MSGEYDLRPLRGILGQLGKNREHPRMQPGLRLLDGNQRSGVGIREDRDKNQEAKSAVGEAGGGLLGAQRAPTETELDALVGSRRKEKLLIVVSESGRHGSIDRSPELAVTGIESMEDRSQILSVRRNPLLQPSHSCLTYSALSIDPKGIVDRPTFHPEPEFLSKRDSEGARDGRNDRLRLGNGVGKLRTLPLKKLNRGP